MPAIISMQSMVLGPVPRSAAARIGALGALWYPSYPIGPGHAPDSLDGPFCEAFRMLLLLPLPP